MRKGRGGHAIAAKEPDMAQTNVFIRTNNI
jgi:hypothetical protein